MSELQTNPTQELDTSGLCCPLPILKTKKQLGSMDTGAVLKMVSTDAGSVKDIPAFCLQTGHGLLASEQEGDNYIFHIRKN